MRPDPYPLRDFVSPSPAVEKRVNGLIAKLSLENKIDMLGGTGNGTTPKEDAGIPLFRMGDGPVGIHWWCDRSVTYPATIGLAASWDAGLAERFGVSIGRDCRARGVHILLAPGVNIYRSPLCGRNFEYLGEDPCLSARMVTPVIRGLQSQGVAATVKHYAANFQEYDRHGVSSDMDERTLREVYLPAFRAAVIEGGAGCIMTAYNPVNGIHCSEHRQLVRDILQGEWGFQGLTMSDWHSTYDAVSAANNGVDIEMPTGERMNRESLLPAVEQGLVTEDVIDDKIRRILRLGVCFGWFDREQKDTSIPEDDPASREVSLQMARESCVLLKNSGLLPLDMSGMKTIAVIGPGAHPAVIGGGGSSYNPPTRTVSILDGIRHMAGKDIDILHSPGFDPYWDWDANEKPAFTTPNGKPGVNAEYFANEGFQGEPAISRIEDCIALQPNEKLLQDTLGTWDNWSVRWRGYITPEEGGEYLIVVRSTDATFVMKIDGGTVIDTGTGIRGGRYKTPVSLKKGEKILLEVDWTKTHHWPQMDVGLVPVSAIKKVTQEAVETARKADAVVICAGFNQFSESEQVDRDFGLDDSLNTLISRASEANPNAVVILTGGGNIDVTPWLDLVKAVLHGWYPGQEGGVAIAEILFGEFNPCGKLPATFEKKLEDRSSFDCYHDDDEDKAVFLSDGIFTGYRHFDRENIEPLFPFGFGLSYTTFEYSSISLSSDEMSRGDRVTVSFSVTNTGDRPGAEVVQMYISDVESTYPRSVKELKGFARVELDPGETKTVTLDITEEDLSYFDPDRKEWTVEPGDFEVLIGASCTDIRLRATFKM